MAATQNLSQQSLDCNFTPIRPSHGVVTLYPDHTVFSGDPYWTLSRAESRAAAARPA